jgi:hypothetical protein
MSGAVVSSWALFAVCVTFGVGVAWLVGRWGDRP